jgi:putative membrane protein
MKFITKLLLIALTLLLVAQYVPGIEVSGLYPAIIAALVLGLLNLIVKPILLILTFPITVLTVGVFVLIINTFLFSVAASFVSGFTVAGFWSAFIGSLIVSAVSTIGNRYL